MLICTRSVVGLSVLTAGIVLAAEASRAADPPTTRAVLVPVTAAPTTGPVLVGPSISSEYARPIAPVTHVPGLRGSPGQDGATVNIGGGTDVGQTGGNPVPAATTGGAQPLPTTRPN